MGDATRTTQCQAVAIPCFISCNFHELHTSRLVGSALEWRHNLRTILNKYCVCGTVTLRAAAAVPNLVRNGDDVDPFLAQMSLIRKLNLWVNDPANDYKMSQGIFPATRQIVSFPKEA